jgi:hypothetical protein
VGRRGEQNRRRGRGERVNGVAVRFGVGVSVENKKGSREGGISVLVEEAARDSRSSVTEGKGLLAKGRMGWNDVEKSKRAG